MTEYTFTFIKNVRMWHLEGTDVYFQLDYLRRVSNGYIRRVIKEHTGITIDDKNLGKLRNPIVDRIVLRSETPLEP